ncbi:outer membrane beta-barrel protein [candidate division KSB1 bacterium]|nr:outer membrane beta-barrel protein [candidate division KSB1 bacterium]
MRRQNWWSLFLAFVLVAGVSAAQGQWHAQAYLGYSSIQASDLQIIQPTPGNKLTFHRLKYDGRSFDLPLYYGARVGAFFSRQSRNVRLALELEFIHAKIYANPSQVLRVSGKRTGQPMDRFLQFREMVQRFSISHGTNFVLTNLALHYGGESHRSAWRRFLTVTGRLGAGPTILHTESTIDGVSQEQYELNRLGVQAALGLEMRLWQQLHFFGEYKFTFNQVHHAKIVDGAANTTLRMHHWVFGLGGDFKL